jgi:hypothetical protein
MLSHPNNFTVLDSQPGQRPPAPAAPPASTQNLDDSPNLSVLRVPKRNETATPKGAKTAKSSLLLFYKKEVLFLLFFFEKKTLGHLEKYPSPTRVQ